MAGIDAAHLLAAFAFGLDVTLYALDTVLIYNTIMTAAYEEYLEGGSEELDEIFADTAANGFTSLVMAQYYGELISTARWWTESSERQDRGNRYPDSGIKTGEIFGDSEGKLKDTTENRQLLERLANSEDNYCGTDRYGNEWYAKTNADGSQTWVKVKNGEIKAGGTNKSETAWNYDTGMQEAGWSDGGSNTNKLFKNQALLDEHYGKHGQEIADVLGDSNYSIDKYLDDANYIINNGTYAPELNGYVSFMSGKKYGFVGLDRTTGDITTFHIKNISELIKKAPSLGFER